jgi:hypothetical protein
VAYLVATVILAIGALIGAFTYVSYPENPENPENNVAWKSPAVAKDHAISPRQKEFVGQITGTFNCNWASSTQSPVTRDVAVGQEYAIASGLMEITYDTGAKVILQGPCTYAVESAASGYLSVGKLTAKMEKKDGKVASDRWPVASGEKNAGGSAFSEGLLAASHQPLFTIKTPTAIVTDLGTEFGVEIDEQGRTVSEVFAGHVSIQRLGDGNDPQRALVLGKGQTAKCGPKGEVSVSNAPSDATRFVRTIPADPTHQTCIVERFDGDKLGSAFEQMPPNRYVFEKGAAIYRQPLTTGGKQSRGYIRTVATDFCNRDFTFEVTIDIRPGAALKPDGTHSIFVGIGDGVPNGAFYDEVVTGLSLVFSADDGRLVVQSQVPSSTVAIPTNTTVAALSAAGVLQPGKHRVRVSKSGDNIRFTLDADYDGRFRADFHGRDVKLRAVAPLLNETNSRLFVGTGNCDAVAVRFEDITITCQDNVHQKEESKPHDE